MKKTRGIVILFLLVSLGHAALAAERWYEFKGVYVGQKADQLKKLGFTCTKPTDPKVAILYDEKCAVPGGTDPFSTFGGEKVTLMEVTIKKGLVHMIYLKTMGRYGGGLETAMATRYGKPKEARGSWQHGSFLWDRGGPQHISLGMENGVNEVIFWYDDIQMQEREQTSKSNKDF